MIKKLNKHLFAAAFLAGALGVVWVGFGFIDSSLLALSMTALIAAVYVFGALELRLHEGPFLDRHRGGLSQRGAGQVHANQSDQ